MSVRRVLTSVPSAAVQSTLLELRSERGWGWGGGGVSWRQWQYRGAAARDAWRLGRAMQVRGLPNDSLGIRRFVVNIDVDRQPTVDFILEAPEFTAEPRRRVVQPGTWHVEIGSERLRHQDRRRVHHVKLR